MLIEQAEAAESRERARCTALEAEVARLQVSGRFHILCGRFDWDLPICCVFLS